MGLNYFLFFFFQAREDEIPTTKVCPLPAAEKQLAWFDADQEDERRRRSKSSAANGMAGGGLLDDDDDSDDEEESGSGGIGGKKKMDSSDMKEARAERKRGVMNEVVARCKKRTYRVNTTTRTWRSVVDGGSLEPSDRVRLREEKKEKERKERQNMGGLDAEQEDMKKMIQAQEIMNCPEHVSHSFQLKRVHGMANSPGTHTHVHYMNRGSEIVFSAGKIVIVQNVRYENVHIFFCFFCLPLLCQSIV